METWGELTGQPLTVAGCRTFGVSEHVSRWPFEWLTGCRCSAKLGHRRSLLADFSIDKCELFVYFRADRNEHAIV